MIRVALVEDEESSQRTLTEYLERFSQEINEKIHVSIFPDGAEIVEDYRGNYDIILMDILMRYMDGMEAASEIRKVDKEVVILFITSTPQYVMKGYTVDALDYVLKPVSYFAFSQRMQRALERMKHPHAQIHLRSLPRRNAQAGYLPDSLYRGRQSQFDLPSGRRNAGGKGRSV